MPPTIEEQALDMWSVAARNGLVGATLPVVVWHEPVSQKHSGKNWAHMKRSGERRRRAMEEVLGGRGVARATACGLRTGRWNPLLELRFR